MDLTIAAYRRKPRSKVLPVLMIVFAISWGLVVTLIVLQDRMIDAQRDLIHQLFKTQHHTMISNARNSRPADKSAAKAGHSRDQVPAASDSAPSISSQVPSDLQPSAQVPLSENASSQTPSSQAKSQAGSKSGRNSRKAAKPAPAQPPVEVTDPSDLRRVLNSI